MVFAVVNHAAHGLMAKTVTLVSSPGGSRVWTDYPPTEQELFREAICAYMLCNTVILMQGFGGTGF